MATYETTVRTALPPADAFEYMADLRNFAEWDPGVQAVEQVVGSGASPDAEFRVTVDGPGRGVDFLYRTTEFDPPRSVTVEASTRLFTSLDRIDVAARSGSEPGSTVTYRAELRLNGPLRFADPLLGPVFNRIAGRADEGLQRVLGDAA